MSFRLKPDAQAMRGILYYTMSMATFSLMDATIKHLIGTFHFSQIILFRSLFAIPPMLVYFYFSGVKLSLPRKNWALHVIRLLCMFVAMSLFFVSLRGLKLGQATAIALLAPVLMTVFSVIVMRERVTRGRIVALLLGLCGPVLIVKPFAGTWSDAEFVYVNMALFSTIFYAGAVTLTKMLADRGEGDNIVLATSLGLTVLSIPVASVSWQASWLDHYEFFIAAGLFGGLATILAVRAVELASIGTIAPFDYTMFLFAAFIGYVVWDESLGWPVWVGVALVALSMVIIRFEDQRRAAIVGAGGGVPTDPVAPPAGDQLVTSRGSQEAGRVVGP